jgi:hypothetical protein
VQRSATFVSQPECVHQANIYNVQLTSNCHAKSYEYPTTSSCIHLPRVSQRSKVLRKCCVVPCKWIRDPGDSRPPSNHQGVNGRNQVFMTEVVLLSTIIGIVTFCFSNCWRLHRLKQYSSGSYIPSSPYWPLVEYIIYHTTHQNHCTFCTSRDERLSFLI